MGYGLDLCSGLGLRDGLDLDALPWDPDIRATLEADLAGRGLGVLVARLRAAAPALAANLARRWMP